MTYEYCKTVVDNELAKFLLMRERKLGDGRPQIRAISMLVYILETNKELSHLAPRVTEYIEQRCRADVVSAILKEFESIHCSLESQDNNKLVVF